VRKRALLSLSLPLAAVGCLAGHAAGYALAGVSRQDARIHGYLALAPQFTATCLVLVLLGVTLRLTGRLQGHPAAWPFALLPPLAFCAQELIERLVVGLPAHSILEPAVFAGLAAQAPLAFVAYLAARALLRWTDAAVRALAPRPAFALHRAPLPAPVPASRLARAPLAFDRLGRAPPGC
jgi:hypothetical protein